MGREVIAGGICSQRGFQVQMGIQGTFGVLGLSCASQEGLAPKQGRLSSLLQFQGILDRLDLLKCLNNQHSQQSLRSFTRAFSRTLGRHKLHLELLLSCREDGLGISDYSMEAQHSHSPGRQPRQQG